ncbi:MAG: hypothetical protein IT300_02175 [Dehalococcoidia bacterium]|nr:hypothetical protein [Dehalococcoidia bacterium]
MDPHGEQAPRRELDGSPPARRAPLGSPSRDREYVPLPSWVVDEILAPAKPVVWRLTINLYRHGWPQVAADGSRRIWWRGSLIELARLIGATKPAIIESERWLADRGFLAVHRSSDPRRPHSLSVPADRPSGKKFLPLPEAETAQHDGDLLISPLPKEDLENTTTTPAAPEEAAVRISYRLSAYGVTAPERWLAERGETLCTAALDYLDTLDASTFTNPAGFLRTLVYSPRPLPLARSPMSPGPAPADDLEARKRKYLGGLAAQLRSGRL